MINRILLFDRLFNRDKLCRFTFHPVITRMSSNTNNESIHSAAIHEIHEIPMDAIIRPLIPVLDEKKVKSLMETIKTEESIEKVPPIDVLWVVGSEGGNYYFSFGGCHRFEANKRLNRPFIRAKLIRSTLDDIKVYLGSSMPDLK
ncbi:sulfiredoxin [Brevipalpus obovatus]|uniref:sulfiredoxin n=1 Tax=Brevipalpus obovatus TaxID=246614 RepID=UPI003D9F7884